MKDDSMYSRSYIICYFTAWRKNNKTAMADHIFALIVYKFGKSMWALRFTNSYPFLD